MNDKRNDVLNKALDRLRQELEREPLSPERVAALVGAIEILAKINPLEERVAVLERQLAEQPDIEQISKDLAKKIPQSLDSRGRDTSV